MDNDNCVFTKRQFIFLKKLTKLAEDTPQIN